MEYAQPQLIPFEAQTLAWRTISHCILDDPHYGLRVSHFDNQLVIPLVMQIDDNSFFRVVDVPEYAFAVLIKGSRRDDSRYVGSGQPDAVPPAACDLRVCSDARYVDEGYFETGLQSPKLIGATRVCDPRLDGALALAVRDAGLEAATSSTRSKNSCPNEA